MWMKSNRIDEVSVSIVVLKEAVAAHIKDFDFLVRGAGSKTSAVRMELNIGDHTSVVSEGVDHGAILSQVPQLYGTVIRAGSNEPRVEGELRFPDPVVVSFESGLEFLFGYRP